MTITLTRIGNSKAVIIPAKILHQYNITENSILDLNVDDGKIVISKTDRKKKEPVFSKVILPEITEDDFESFRAGLMTVSEEEIASDERLAYILNRQ